MRLRSGKKKNKRGSIASKYLRRTTEGHVILKGRDDVHYEK